MNLIKNTIKVHKIRIGLHPQVLQTPYPEIIEFHVHFRDHPPKKVCDIGAGYGELD